tara:strand:+ start:82 stop:594 length:513 start_codon:yes stop_codon:yes gene_type:complete
MSQLYFNPMLTPREMVEMGVFGGCYFGVEVMNTSSCDYQELFDYHFKDLDPSLYLGKTYKKKINKFNIKSGASYSHWYDQGWMHDDDPYGWFEWYCKYTMGREHEDDERQILRWQSFCGKTGRWKKRIYIRIEETKDMNVSPRIQQSLLHWGYLVNENDHEEYKESINRY